jgi:hypothetical protein
MAHGQLAPSLENKSEKLNFQRVKVSLSIKTKHVAGLMLMNLDPNFFPFQSIFFSSNL